MVVEEVVIVPVKTLVPVVVMILLNPLLVLIAALLVVMAVKKAARILLSHPVARVVGIAVINLVVKIAKVRVELDATLHAKQLVILLVEDIVIPHVWQVVNSFVCFHVRRFVGS